MRRVAATITYVTIDNVYVGAGRTQGLAPGDTLLLRRGGESLGEIVISAVSGSSSLASVLRRGLSPAVGDSVFIHKRVPVTRQLRSRPSVAMPEGRSAPSEGMNTLSGRIGLQYSGVGRAGQSPDLSQPALVGRLDVGRLFGTSMTFRMNGRVAHDATGRILRYGENSRTHTRVYELSLTSDSPGQRFGFGLGRILPRYVSGLGTFDGGEVYGRLGTISAGVVAGTQANYSTSGVDMDHQRFAAFVNVGWGRDVWNRSEVTIAYGQQLYRGRLDRNFTFIQTSLRIGPQFTVYGSSEFDFHKTTSAGMISRFNLTNSFLSLNYTPGFRWITISAGYDATRPAPLLQSERTFLDSLLDRSLRQGLRGVVAFSLPARVVIGASGTHRLPTRTAPRAYSANMWFRVSDVFGTGCSFGTQYGTITSIYSRGRDLSLDVDQWLTESITLGIRLDRYDYRLENRGGSYRTLSASLNGSWRISREWYLAVSADRVWEDQVITQRLYLELGTHF